ncbi:MAG: hypothetical protein BroJett003_07120 [Planctomycetota bacterium]|nr:MAG: hypothetical protein BroJett003_07120 [Planctomycetota bacterium]
MPARSIIYVDGFNFYYGAVRGSSHKWLNLALCFRHLRPHDQIQRIHYFTAIVDGETRTNQEIYLRALATTPEVNVILGKFKFKERKCQVTSCTFNGSRTFVMPEEKRTDVNIAVQLLRDIYHDNADRFIVVSGDSDLVPALNLAKSEAPEKKIIVYVPSRNPTRGAAVELRSAADRNRTFPLRLLSVSQFPSALPDGQGGFIHKPAGW